MNTGCTFDVGSGQITRSLLYIGLYMTCSIICTESTPFSLFTGCSDPIGATVNRQNHAQVCTG